MPTKRSAPRSKKSGDVLAMLKQDHDKVKKMFKEFERMTADDEAGEEAEQLARRICTELKIHTTLEEEIFYPAARNALEDDADLIDEAEVEHASAKDLIEQIESSGAADDKWAAKVCVLGEYINHHVQEEEKEMFPKVKRAKQLDLEEMAGRLAGRKQELMSEMGIGEDSEEDDGQMQGRAQKGRSTGRSSHATR